LHCIQPPLIDLEGAVRQRQHMDTRLGASTFGINQVGVVNYFALASGFLTGKYRTSADTAKSTRGKGIIEKYLSARGLRILAALDEVGRLARQRGPRVADRAAQHHRSNRECNDRQSGARIGRRNETESGQGSNRTTGCRQQTRL
jgi:hypothetical protein